MAPATGGPMRLSPKVLLIDPVRMLPSLLLPLVGVLFVGGFSTRSFVWAALGVLGTVVYAVVRWATFSYRIIGDRLEIKRSLISRSVRTIPIERIRGVDVSTPPMHRLLGLAVLKLDTGAGGGEEEGELDGLTVEEAERLKSVLLRRAPSPAVAPAETPANPAHAGYPEHPGHHPGNPEHPGGAVFPGHSGYLAHPGHPAHSERAGHSGRPGYPEHSREQGERVIIRVPRAWLVYGPLSGAYLLTPFALAGGAIGLAFQWGDELGFGRDAAWSLGEWLWQRPYLLLAAVVLLVVAMPFVGGVMYAVFNWDFTLKHRDGYLVAERGLVNRRSVSLESRRVRGYELADGLAERWAGVVRAWAIVTGLGDSRARGQLLPDVPRAVAEQVTSTAIGPYTAPLRPHPPVARDRRLFRAVAPWLALAASAALVAVLTQVGGWWALVALALLLAAVGVPLGLDRYHSLGHGYDGVRLSVRSGSLRRAQAVVERRAVVGWRMRQTWFQRRAGVLTLTAGVGAGQGGYSAIDVSWDQAVSFPSEVTPDWLAPFVVHPEPRQNP
ncbi:PH domain-containing protein [Nonomuraea longicatena]|uniref:YdbS-like PH domain-containing protein n=1 Tax=Nonomuraea longicatena TaxID=83682 RepID=A0ABN1NMG4_9ACTN